MRTTTIHAWMTLVAESVKDRRDYLTQLDAAIGDGDHGVNMDRGFDAVGKALAAQDGALPPGQAPDPGRQDARVDRRRSERPALGNRVPPRGPRTRRRARSSTARTWSPRSARRSTASSSSAPPSRATRRWSTRSVPAIDALRGLARRGRAARAGTRRRHRGRRGGGEGHGAAPGPEGPRVLSRRALDRPSGPGRHVSRARHGRAPAGGRAGELMSERVLRGAPASPGLAAGHARVLSHPSEDPRVHRSPTPSVEAEAERARARARGGRRGARAHRARLRARAAGTTRPRSSRPGALMAADPLLEAAVTTAVHRARVPAAGRAARGDGGARRARSRRCRTRSLAARADDVRSLGRRAARIADGGAPTSTREERGDVHPRGRGPRARGRGRARRAGWRGSRCPAAR